MTKLKRPPNLPPAKGNNSDYFQEVAQKCKERAEALDERLKKAEGLGANVKGHAYHRAYLKLKKEAERQWEYVDEYLEKAQLLDALKQL